MKKKFLLSIFLLSVNLLTVNCQQVKQSTLMFGKAVSLHKFISDKAEKEKPLKWVNVNTDPVTWNVEKDLLVCSGKPIGVMRSEKQYENFILHIEWMHMEAGGNSGVFVWSNANPPVDKRLPDGVEVQMLELDWINLNKKDGVTPPEAYVHGELFGVGGVKTIPDNPRGTRSKSVENRCKGKGEWNTYDVVCIDGSIRLSVNGKFVNGITKASQKKGYLCLESEGSEIHFRNLKIIELAPGVTPYWQIAPDLDNTTRSSSSKPLSLNPLNPHYFLFRDQPLVLIGSTEHYGAVMNLDFDYITYLDEIAECGLNVTRTFSGVYVEPRGAFKIEKNTLAPASGRFICPWARSSVPGYANGGNKFDLTQWDDAYFSRLRNFIAEAGKRNIIVELDLFSNFYDTIQWKLSPLNMRNNINGTGGFTDWKEVLSLKHKDVLDAQEKMARKIISELKDLDNLYYEICNEPYFGDTTALKEWERHMTPVVMDAEKDFADKHLVSSNVANHYRLLTENRPGVSVYNFHYASPPKTVPANYHLNKVIGDNETGFAGIKDEPYRKEAWDFILSGGGLYDNLDYSFTTDNEDGTFIFREGQPGGGGKHLRNQLGILAAFMKEVDFINMKPVDKQIVRLGAKGKITVNGLYNDKDFALYVNRHNSSESQSMEVNVPAGSYRLTFIDTVTGNRKDSLIKDHHGGWLKISLSDLPDEPAVRIQKIQEK
jgi:hypothetical protein